MSLVVAPRDSSWPVVASSASRSRKGSYQSSQRKERMQTLRYGIGMWLGLVAVHVTKKIIKSIPVVGAVAKPVLNLIPTIVVGPAIGAAVVFTLDEGDVDSARRKVRKAAKNIHKDMEQAASSIHKEITGLVKDQEPSQSLIPREVNDRLQRLDAQVTPAVEKEFKRLQRALEDFRRSSTSVRAQLQDVASGRRDG